MLHFTGKLKRKQVSAVANEELPKEAKKCEPKNGTPRQEAPRFSPGAPSATLRLLAQWEQTGLWILSPNFNSLHSTAILFPAIQPKPEASTSTSGHWVISLSPKKPPPCPVIITAGSCPPLHTLPILNTGKDTSLEALKIKEAFIHRWAKFPYIEKPTFKN